jgi:hypothetical protein
VVKVSRCTINMWARRSEVVNSQDSLGSHCETINSLLF